MKISLVPLWMKILGPLALLAALAGVGWGLKNSRDHWKSLANSRQTTITHLQTRIDGMTTAQDVQHGISEKTVTQVVQGPERVRTIVKHIHDAPNPADCATPDLDYMRSHT